MLRGRGAGAAWLAGHAPAAAAWPPVTSRARQLPPPPPRQSTAPPPAARRRPRCAPLLPRTAARCTPDRAVNNNINTGTGGVPPATGAVSDAVDDQFPIFSCVHFEVWCIKLAEWS
ncbi:hypothetical protein EVAR_53277_1 [Eumeta japonica]|uniref:Uncharacterized protein n=1 Tax=Eumeta variegata TaxID=151549 RepID=A0A4C1YM98_EUMVA|nr:hypothetical protein EVAR_53277_1 [Eumeta japonica]